MLHTCAILCRLPSPFPSSLNVVLTTPSGGMGLTGGFADITSLYDCLMAIQNGLTTDKILDKYSEIRIKKWAEIIDPVSRANFRRLWAEDAIPERLAFFEMCKKMETDEVMQKQGAAVRIDSIHCFAKASWLVLTNGIVFERTK
jgi:hypothetical protein